MPSSCDGTAVGDAKSSLRCLLGTMRGCCECHCVMQLHLLDLLSAHRGVLGENMPSFQAQNGASLS